MEHIVEEQPLAAVLLVAIPTHVASHLLDERLGELTLTLQEVVESLRNGRG